MCPQGAQAPSITRRTDTNTNSVAWANPSALLQRLAYPTRGDCQAQTRRRRAPSVPLAVIPTLNDRHSPEGVTQSDATAPRRGAAPVSPNLHAPRHSRESGNLPLMPPVREAGTYPLPLSAQARRRPPICDNRPLRERPLPALRWIPTAKAARSDAGGKRTRRAKGAAPSSPIPASNRPKTASKQPQTGPSARRGAGVNESE